MDSIYGISLFVKAAETLSFIDVARTTGLSASAVGKSIARLERSIGVTLFRRTTRSMTLTSEGEIFLHHCRNILEEFHIAKQKLDHISEEPSGPLRITLPLVGPLFNPILKEFISTNPNVQLDVHFSDHFVDLVEGGFDAAVRIGDIDDSRLVRRHLGSFRMQVVASAKYLQIRGTPRTPQDLSNHSCLLYKYPSSGKFEEWPLPDWRKITAGTFSHYTVSNAIESLLFFAESGCGIACLPDFLVKRSIAAKKLVAVLEDYESPARDLNILWPPGRYMTTKLRRFIDILTETLIM